MSSPFDRTPRPSIFANDPAFQAPRTAKAIDAARKAYDKKEFKGAIPWQKNEPIVAYSRAVPKKGDGNA